MIKRALSFSSVKWIIKRKRIKSNIFGKFINDKNQGLIFSFLRSSTSYIKKYGMVDGIFSKCDNKDRRVRIFRQINSGKSIFDIVQKEDDDIFVVANLIKFFLLQYPKPILHILYMSILKSKKNLNDKQIKEVIRTKMSQQLRAISILLFDLLHTVHMKTNMKSVSLSKIFSASLYSKCIVILVKDKFVWERAMKLTKILIDNPKLFYR